MSFLTSPPEVLLRPLVQAMSRSISTLSAAASTSTSSSSPHGPRAAVCTELKAPIKIFPGFDLNQLRPIWSKIPVEKRVRIDIKACGINFADILIVQGNYQVKPPLPFIPGAEISGVVTEIGCGVKNVSIGDRVIALLDIGGFASECYAHELQVYKIPNSISFETGAALPVSYGTAITGLGHKANIQPGEFLLVTAAAGGVGLASIEIAKNIFGAKVIAAAGGPEKLQVCKERGADFLIDYSKESIKDKVKEFTGGKGVNVVMEVVGGDVFDDCVRALAPDGRLVVIGFASGKIPSIPANILLVKNISTMGLYWGGYQMFNTKILRDSVDRVISECAAGKLNPLVSEKFDLSKLNEAFAFVATRKSVGKVVVTM